MHHKKLIQRESPTQDIEPSSMLFTTFQLRGDGRHPVYAGTMEDCISYIIDDETKSPEEFVVA